MAARLVGREGQLAVAAEYLDGLRAGRGGFLALVGEAGAGKTRLAEEIMALGRTGGARGVWATGWPGDGVPPLWPWVQVLRQLTGSAETLGAFATVTSGTEPAALFAQSDAVALAIQAAAGQEPLVVVLDDLQWADSATLRVLGHVASVIRGVPCLVLGAYRVGELARHDIAELARVGRTLAVPGLADEAAATLLQAAAGGPVTPAAAEAVLRRSRGNPLFVWEFGQLMAQSGRRDVAPASVPEAVAAVIERRLARASEAVIVVLRVGAVAGEVFDADLVAAVGGVPTAEAERALADAAGVGLLATLSGGGYGFSHDVVREVVLDGLDPLWRSELHLRTAQRLATRDDPSLHAVVADHLDRAGRHDDAAQRWELAGHHARGVLAYREAARCFARAGRGARRVAMLVEEGESLLLAGDLGAARSRLAEAAELARAGGDARTLARAVLGMGTGPVAWEVPIASDEQVGWVTCALDLLPDNETALRSSLLARLSVAGARPDTMDEARRRAETALRLAEEVGDPRLIAQALAAVNDALGAPAHATTRRDNADTIVELAAGDPVLELLGHRFRVVADLELGDIAAVDRDIAGFTRLAEALRQPLVGWYVPLFHGMRALLRGDLDEADRCQAEVVAAARATDSANARMLASTLGMGIDVARDRSMDPAQFENLLDVDPAGWATLACGIAVARLRAGDRTGARRMLALHASDGFARVGQDGEQLTTLVLFGRVAVELGEQEAASRLYDLLAPYAGLWAVDGIAACCWGPVEMELGRLALALGWVDEARDHLARARSAAEPAPAPLILAEIAALAAQTGQEPTPPDPTPPEPTRPEPTPPGPTNVFRRDGQFWTLTYGGRTVTMRDAKGLHDLARLLAQPGREIHVLDLLGSTGPAGGDLGELLDARARAEYRRRLAELEAEIDSPNPTRAEKAQAERDFILAELSAALGLGGRARRTADPVERARKAVTARIRLCIGRVESEHPHLARHLANAVQTGTLCRYQPESAISWTM